ncbi:unnamed protein product, partial [Brachionus calyciflorus]
TLNKIRSSNKPSIPDDFASFEISGEFTRTIIQQEFLRYDNNSKDSIVTNTQSRQDAQKDLIYSLFRVEFSSSNDFTENFHGISYHVRYPYDKVFDTDSVDDFIQVNENASPIELVEFPEIDLNFTTDREITVPLNEDQLVNNIQSQSPFLTTLNNAIGEANQVLYSNFETLIPESNMHDFQPVRINRLKPLYEQMQQIDDEIESEEEFDYINGIRDNAVLDQMFEEKRNERARLEEKIKIRVSQLTSENIENEIHPFWQISKLTRQRITDNDVQLAEKRLMRKIREEETNNMHLEFLERYQNK